MRLYKVSFRCFFLNKMADETRNRDRSNTENYGPARDTSQPISARDFTGSSFTDEGYSCKRVVKLSPDKIS